jgi:hypothetical protein
MNGAVHMQNVQYTAVQNDLRMFEKLTVIPLV